MLEKIVEENKDKKI